MEKASGRGEIVRQPRTRTRKKRKRGGGEGGRNAGKEKV